MGISVESYRHHIGSFAAVCFRLTKHRLRSTSNSMKHSGTFVSPLLRILPLFLVSMLLIIGGVEVNPGPGVRDCCGQKFENALGYVDHMKAEDHPSPGDKFPCAFLECASVFSRVESLSVHVGRAHSHKETFQCPVSDCEVTEFKTFKAHLENHLQDGKSFFCPFGTCSFMHQSLSGFKSHMTRYHRGSSSATSAETAELETEFGTSSSSSSSSGKRNTVCDETEVNLIPPEKKMKTSFAVYDDPSTSINKPSTEVPSSRSMQVQDEILQFYLDLEGKHAIPSSTVQMISEKIQLFTEVSHQSLREAVKREMQHVGIDSQISDYVVTKSFCDDPVYNTHHKGLDSHQFTSTYLRKEMMKKKFPFVDSEEVYLGLDSSGNRRVAHYVPVRKMLEVLLQDKELKAEVLKSFLQVTEESDILEDFTDGLICKQHRKNCHEKCLSLIFFQDGFEFNPFGPAKGLYKSIGFYYIIGNLPKEYRSKVKNILLALLLPERHLKPTEDEFLEGINMFEKPLEDLIADLTDLHEHGVVIDNEAIPVCVLFFAGDNLGSNQIAGLVQSFTAKHCCRVCPISMDDFKKNPTKCENPRTPEQYDECVAKAKEMWCKKKDDALARHARLKERHKEAEAPKKKLDLKFKKISGSAYDELKGVNYLGIKYYASPLNKIPGFHVCASTLPPCIAHDLFQGVVSLDVAKILENLIEVKQWFTLETLNRRISQFQYQDNDSADAPSIIKSFDAIKNHAIENWNLVRLLPLIIDDLVKDSNDPMWQLFLQLKEICELCTAPRIRRSQVLYLSSVIKSYLTNLHVHLPSCLTRKHHFMMHYPELIFIYGPLINLFTMRFESNHVFFKTVGKACRSFQNITATLANKYQYKFASDHVNGMLSETATYCPALLPAIIPSDIQAMLPPELNQESASVTNQISCKGTTYKLGQWLIFNKAGGSNLCVGCIETIYCFPNNSVFFKLRQHVAENTHRGFYSIQDDCIIGYCALNVQDLPDFYPLPSYRVQGKTCLTLKHSNIFM